MSGDLSVILWWNGPRGGDIHDPSLADIERVVSSLDGISADECGILVETPTAPVATMVVGGGLEGRLTVQWQWYGPDDWNNDVVMLVDRSQGDRMFANVTGGQKSDMLGRLSVPRAVALGAVRRFTETRQLDDGLDWDFVPAVPGVARELSRAEVQAISERMVQKLLISPTRDR
jgi:hypothetical protein